MSQRVKLVTSLSISAILLLVIGTSGVGNQNVRACDEGCGYGGGYNVGYNQGYGYGGCGGYCAGEQDAVYDHSQGNIYNPVGQCLPCHSDYYWHNFHQGYDDKWNSYQNQDTSQGSSINVNNSPNAYVSVNQYSNQQQNPLQQLAHVACGIINCGGLGSGSNIPYQQSGYDGGYDR